MITIRTVTRQMSNLFAAIATVAIMFAAAQVWAGPEVTVVNTPLPVTGSVSITGIPLPVTGSVAISGTPLPVTGSVSISGNPGVRIGLPVNPFFDEMTLLSNEKKAIGPASGVLGVSAITISNFDASMQQLFLFNPVISGGACNTGTVTGGSTPLAHLILEPQKTIQLLYPTPLVFPLIGGLSCIAGEVTTVHTNAITIGVSGLAQ